MSRLIVGWVTLFVVGTDLFVIAPLIPFLATDYRIGLAAAGLGVTAFSLAYVIAAPVFGRLADGFGRPRILTWCLLAFAAANLLTSEARDLPTMLIARTLCGMAAAGVTPSVYALVGEAAPAGRRGTWIAIVLSGLLLSLAFGAPLGTLISVHIGWAAIFRTLAVCGLLLVVLNHVIWRGARTTTGTSGAPPIFNAAGLARALCPTVAWSTALYGMYTYMEAGLSALGYDTGQITRLAIVYGIAAFAGTLIGGRVADRLGPDRSTRASLLGMAVCFVLLRLAIVVGNEFLIALALASVSSVAQTFFPAQQSLLMSKFPARPASALAWNNSALFLGMTLGSLVGGQAMTMGGLGAILPVSAVLAITGWATTLSRDKAGVLPISVAGGIGRIL